MVRNTFIVGTLLVFVLASPAVRAVELVDDGTLDLELLVQTTIRVEEGQASDSHTLGIDPYLERAWLALSGRPTPRLSFFVQAGVDDVGLDGDWTPAFEPRDAWIEWTLGSRLQLDAGLMRPPWAVHTMLLEATRVGISSHDGLVRYPTGVDGRDVGLQARGRLLEDRLEYRLAGFAGVQVGRGHESTDYDGNGTTDAPPLNPDDLPRVTARLAWSFFDPLGSAGPAGFRVAAQQLEQGERGLTTQRRVLTVGIAADHQQDALYVEERDYTGAVASARRADYTALTADLLADLPLADGQRSLSVLVAGFYFPLDEGHPAAGQGLLAEVGYRIGRLQPYAFYELQDADLSSADDWIAARAGLAWWAQGITANLRLDAGAWRRGGGNDRVFTSSMRAQLYF